MAAVNPQNPGSSSEGKFDITLTIEPLVQISQLTNLPLQLAADNSYADGTATFCVFSNEALGNYDIIATGKYKDKDGVDQTDGFYIKTDSLSEETTSGDYTGEITLVVSPS